MKHRKPGNCFQCTYSHEQRGPSGLMGWICSKTGYSLDPMELHSLNECPMRRKKTRKKAHAYHPWKPYAETYRHDRKIRSVKEEVDDIN